MDRKLSDEEIEHLIDDEDQSRDLVEPTAAAIGWWVFTVSGKAVVSWVSVQVISNTWKKISSWWNGEEVVDEFESKVLEEGQREEA